MAGGIKELPQRVKSAPPRGAHIVRPLEGKVQGLGWKVAHDVHDIPSPKGTEALLRGGKGGSESIASRQAHTLWLTNHTHAARHTLLHMKLHTQARVRGPSGTHLLRQADKQIGEALEALRLRLQDELGHFERRVYGL